MATNEEIPPAEAAVRRLRWSLHPEMSNDMMSYNNNLTLAESLV